MSEPHLPTPPQEPEGLHSTRLVILIVATLAIFTASTVIVFWLEHAWTKGRQDYRHATLPAQVEQPKINMVEQVPFAEGPRAAQTRDAQKAQLSGWGWVDRKKGIAHEPVDLAMDALVKEAAR